MGGGLRLRGRGGSVRQRGGLMAVCRPRRSSCRSFSAMLVRRWSSSTLSSSSLIAAPQRTTTRAVHLNRRRAFQSIRACSPHASGALACPAGSGESSNQSDRLKPQGVAEVEKAKRWGHTRKWVRRWVRGAQRWFRGGSEGRPEALVALGLVSRNFCWWFDERTKAEAISNTVTDVHGTNSGCGLGLGLRVCTPGAGGTGISQLT